MKRLILPAALIIMFLCVSDAAAEDQTDDMDKIVLVSGEVLVGYIDTVSEHSLMFLKSGSTEPDPVNMANIKSLALGPATLKSKNELRDFDRIVRRNNAEPFEGNIAADNETDTMVYIWPNKYDRKMLVPVEKKNILRIERKAGPRDVFLFKVRILKPQKNETARALYDAADWASPYRELDPDVIALLKRIRKTWPDFVEAYMLLSDKYAQAREAGKASVEDELGLYEDAARHALEVPVLYLRMGELLKAEGMTTLAMNAFENAADIARKQNNAALAGRALLEKASIHVARREFDGAKKILSELLADGDSNYNILVALGDCLVAEGDFAQAEQRYRSATELESSVPEPRVKLGRAYLIQGKLAEARDELKKAHELGAPTAESNTLLALTLARMGDFKAAADAVAKALESSQTVDACLAEGYLKENMGDFATALDSYRKAAQAGDQSGAAHYYAGGALLMLKKYAEAEKELGDALKIGFDATLTFDLLSASARAQGNLPNAARFMRYALASEDTADRRYTLGMLFFLSKKTAEAEAEFRKALAIDANHPEALYGLGVILRDRGETETALADFQKALNARPDEPRFALAVKRTQGISSQEVWVDPFDREDSSEVHNGWEKYEGFGVPISIKNRVCVFEGTQRTKETDRTTLLRKEDPATKRTHYFARFEAEILGEKNGAARYGIRVFDAAPNGEVLNAIVLARDYSGAPVLFYKGDSGDGWVGPVDLKVQNFDESAAHFFAIEISDRKKGEFSVYLDNVLVKALTIPSLANSTGLLFGVFGQAPTGTAWKLTVKSVKMFYEKRKSEKR
jgi:tetratricopeptide (TPR) repeat protein